MFFSTCVFVYFTFTEVDIKWTLKFLFVTLLVRQPLGLPHQFLYALELIDGHAVANTAPSQRRAVKISYRAARRYAPADRGWSTSVRRRIRNPYSSGLAVALRAYSWPRCDQQTDGSRHRSCIRPTKNAQQSKLLGGWARKWNMTSINSWWSVLSTAVYKLKRLLSAFIRAKIYLTLLGGFMDPRYL